MRTRRSYYYDISKRYLMLVGQWPYQKPKEKLIYFTFIMILATTSLIPQGARFGVCKSAQCIYETLPPYMLGVIILVKILTYHFNSQKIKDLTDHLFVDWDMLETKEEHDIMRKYAEKGRWYSLIYGCKFVELIEHIFTIPFAAQIIVVTIGLSVTLLQFTQQEGDILISIKYVLYVIAQLFHLFCLSFEGQKLIDHSIQMCDKIYSSTWYEVSMKSQKLIVMVMMKSVRPSFLSAGKIYILSLESFTMVLQTSMSYFTVLASI
ncbi:PREDICTED: uncharacterized protein LOC108772992 [Cyphomyrmex costatus]|uniref:uncharacterized protein LOC108772992 n=1 Tax=Cyphomyrmex costatus TaxID=456900 RepID=UPI0008523B19|nr:PREDICTED: uncharacterized protein LOC108772992 [Cyphomyrmex costatus]